MRVLALDAAGLSCSAALLEDGRCLAERCGGDTAGPRRVLPGLVDALLAESAAASTPWRSPWGRAASPGCAARWPWRTAWRSAAACPWWASRVAEALLHGCGPAWVALDARRPGRVFLDTGGGMQACRLDAVPVPPDPVVVVGDAAEAVVCPAARCGGGRGAHGVRRVVGRSRCGGWRARSARATRNRCMSRQPAVRDARGGVIAVTALHAAALAAIHAAAFPPGERWDAAAFAGLLATPGTFGLLDERGGFVLARQAGGEAELLTLAVLPAVAAAAASGAAWSPP